MERPIVDFKQSSEGGVASDGDLEKRLSKRTGRRGWSMIERRTTKAGSRDEGLGYFLRLRFASVKKKVGSCLEETSVRVRSL